MPNLTPNQLYGLTAIAVAVISYLALTYRPELGAIGDWLGSWFKRTPEKPDADEQFNAALAACDVLYKHPDAEVQRLAALAAKRVTELAYPVPGVTV